MRTCDEFGALGPGKRTGVYEPVLQHRLLDVLQQGLHHLLLCGCDGVVTGHADFDHVFSVEEGFDEIFD